MLSLYAACHSTPPLCFIGNKQAANCTQRSSRSVARTISRTRRSRCLAGVSMEHLLIGHESILAVVQAAAWHASLSILARQLQVCAGVLFGFRGAWSTVRKEQRAFGRFYASSAAIGVCLGVMSASVRIGWKMGSRSRSEKDVVSQPWRLVGSRRGQGSREAPGPVVPDLVRFAA